LKPAARVRFLPGGLSLAVYPSEDVSQRPEGLRKKMERGEVAREEEEREV
jgi:hypothetical protein